MGVRAAARGSGASSLVNYLIDISQVNPLQHDLIFERFLSRDRATLPDIDIDVESAERHNVYRKIFERFGAERVTLMSMQNGYRARGAVRDAGLALGMDDGEVGEIAKQLWRFSARKFREALVEKPELREFAGPGGAARLLREPAAGPAGGPHGTAGPAAPPHLHAPLRGHPRRRHPAGPHPRAAQRPGPAHEPVRQARHGPHGHAQTRCPGRPDAERHGLRRPGSDPAPSLQGRGGGRRRASGRAGRDGPGLHRRGRAHRPQRGPARRRAHL